MKKFNRNYKWTSSVEIMPAIGLGVAIGNHQPKNKYNTADWVFTIVILCFVFNIGLGYNYK